MCSILSRLVSAGSAATAAKPSGFFSFAGLGLDGLIDFFEATFLLDFFELFFAGMRFTPSSGQRFLCDFASFAALREMLFSAALDLTAKPQRIFKICSRLQSRDLLLLRIHPCRVLSSSSAIQLWVEWPAIC